MLILYYARTTKYTVLKSEEGNILIIKNKQHSKILDAIISNKKALLRERYFYFNKDNAPEVELNKYKYLLTNGAISHDEFREISAQLLKNEGVIKELPAGE